MFSLSTINGTWNYCRIWTIYRIVLWLTQTYIEVLAHNWCFKTDEGCNNTVFTFTIIKPQRLQFTTLHLRTTNRKSPKTGHMLLQRAALTSSFTILTLAYIIIMHKFTLWKEKSWFIVVLMNTQEEYCYLRMKSNVCYCFVTGLLGSFRGEMKRNQTQKSSGKFTRPL